MIHTKGSNHNLIRGLSRFNSKLPRIHFSIFTISLFSPIFRMSQQPISKTIQTNGSQHFATATFGAGCFWGVQKAFKEKFAGKGLIEASVGYAGGSGDVNQVNYRQVCSGTTGFAEVVQLKFDPAVLPYSNLVDFFYRSHDPLTKNSQGADRGTQYRSAIFYHDNQQKAAAEEGTKAAQTNFGSKTIQTTIEPIGTYVNGEDYHQDYLEKNQGGYECSTHFEKTWDQIRAKFKV